MKAPARLIVALFTAVAFITIAPLCPAPIFVMIPGVPGDSQVEGHEDEIDVLSWSWGMSNPSGATYTNVPPVSDRLSRDDFSVTKNVDSASPKLMLACATGEQIPEVFVTITDPASMQPYLTWELKRVQVSSYSIRGDESGAAGGDQIPVEDFSLNYEEIKVTYMKQGQPPISEGWDFVADAPSDPGPM